MDNIMKSAATLLMVSNLINDENTEIKDENTEVVNEEVTETNDEKEEVINDENTEIKDENTEVVNEEVTETNDENTEEVLDEDNNSLSNGRFRNINKSTVKRIIAGGIVIGTIVVAAMSCGDNKKETTSNNKTNSITSNSNNKTNGGLNTLPPSQVKEKVEDTNNKIEKFDEFVKKEEVKEEIKEEVSEVVNEVVEKEIKEEELLAEIEAERNAQFVSYDEYYNTYLKFFKKYKDLLNVKSTDAIVYYMNYGLLNDETKEDIVGKFVVNNRNDVNNDLVIAFGDFVNYNINVYKERISKPTIVKETFKLSDAAAKSEHKQTFEYFDSLIDIMATGSQEDAINAYYELHNTLIYLDADVKNETEDATEKYDRIGYNELTAGEQQISKMYYCVMAPQIMNERIRIEQFNFAKEEKDWQTTWKYDSKSNTVIKSTITDDFSLAAADTINTLSNASDCIVLVKKQ